MSEPQATKAALAYFACVRARDPDGLAELCAQDVQVLLHDGRAFLGREGVRSAYMEMFAKGADPQPDVLSTISEGDACAAEFLARRPDGTTGRATDIFRVDAAGLVREMRVYVQTC